ncbi:MAG: hypothetical protein UR61_C0060G0004 [candidate division WS6 bacterium GW2011_GWE1_34_7]|uniref:DUF4349 domain-containing protein n=1 Tax=candidate division WS6 bacterium GW2011_GWE1_34_7 TaxID=1619093 RepID=A0A0G0DLA1_9BACT|nr:MAG: hypothetical protein UR61_C0060G0004 [candidate division WS6 bacterium GW2011_GWE1_34_7]
MFIYILSFKNMSKKSLFILLFIALVLGILLFIGMLIPRFSIKEYQGGDDYYSTDSLYAPDYLAEVPAMDREEMVNTADGSKIQKSGTVSFLVENIDTSVESTKLINTKYSAQITNIYDYGRGNDRVVSITVKVPVTDFEKYYEEVREIEGEVTYANISTLDVTEEYIDITSRLKNLRSVEEQLVGILQKAENVTDTLAVQRELNTVRGEIESYEQRKRYFDSQTDYSYISISFSIDKTGLNISDEEWKPFGEFRAALNALLSLLKGFVNATIWMLVFSPIVLVPVGIVLYIVKRKNQKTK